MPTAKSTTVTKSEILELYFCYKNVQFLDLFGKSIQFIDILERTAKYFFQKIATRLMNICIH